MDRRTQRTRRAVYEAFSTLLSRKKYSQITIQEIIDAADIGRSTFYAHFNAKEDLLKEVCNELFQHIFYHAPPPPPRREGGCREEDVCLLLEHILKHMARDGKMIRGILASESSGFFVACFKEYMGEFTDRYILWGGGEELGGIPPAFFKNHVSASFIEAVRWWFDAGCRPAAGELARQYAALILPALQRGPGGAVGN